MITPTLTTNRIFFIVSEGSLGRLRVRGTYRGEQLQHILAFTQRKKTFLALDNRGRARRTQIPVSRPLGNLSPYALSLTRRWDGPKQSHCPPRRHRGKLKRPPPRHRNCHIRLQKANLRHKRKHKKANNPKKKQRHPKTRRKHENGTTTTTEVTWDESTMSTMSTTDAEFFRSATAQEAVARA